MISIFHQRPYFKVGANGPPTLLYMSLKWSRVGGGEEGAGQQEGGGVVRGCEFDTYCAGN
jgi:hypothetical protein